VYLNPLTAQTSAFIAQQLPGDIHGSHYRRGELAVTRFRLNENRDFLNFSAEAATVHQVRFSTEQQTALRKLVMLCSN
jgi:hypothetical protein